MNLSVYSLFENKKIRLVHENFAAESKVTELCQAAESVCKLEKAFYEVWSWYVKTQ